MKKRFLLRLLVYVSSPLILAEILFRIIPYPNELYLSKVDPFYSLKKDTSNTYYCFIGSSHVAAAIVSEVFNSNLKADKIITFNAGRGSSTSTVFYLALKKLIKEGLLDNAKIFLEAPGGLSSYSDNEHSEWVNSQNVHLIIPYLNFHSLKDFWRNSTNDIPTKINLSINYFFYTSRIWSMFKEMYQENTLNDLINKIVNRRKNAEIVKSGINKENNLIEKGGIKADPVNIQIARKLAYSYFRNEIKNQKIIEIPDWQKSRLFEIRNLLKDCNGTLTVFDIPISSVEKQVHVTAVAKHNAENFHKFLKDQNIEYIQFNLSNYSDDYFPDLWHLSKEKAIVYSNSFIDILKQRNAYLK